MESITNRRLLFTFTFLSLYLLLSTHAARTRFSPKQAIAESKVEVSSSTETLTIQKNPKAKKICGATDHPILCVKSVITILEKHGKINVDSVFKASLVAGNKIATDAKNMAEKFAKKSGSQGDLQTSYSDCKDGYDTALENFKKAQAALESKDTGTCRSMLSGVITYLGDCEDEIEPTSPLYTYAQKLTNITDNALALSELIH